MATVYHPSCHLTRGLGVVEPPRAALQAAGVDASVADGGPRCCGFGGSFAVKFPDVSVAMADERLDEFTASDVQTVTSCDLSCLLHLEGRAIRRGLPLSFRHVAELL